MPTYSYPGVYIQELPGGPAPIVGASPSTVALIGFTLEGATNDPILCTSFTEFAEKFGGFTADSLAPTAAFAFFQNGGSMMRMVRVVASDAEKSSGYFTETVTGEVLTPDDVPNDARTLIVFSSDVPQYLPIRANTTTPTVTINDSKATPSVWEDNGAGVLTEAVSGDTGTIDYETGEISLSYTTPPATGITFSIDYTWVNIKVLMKWEGVAGDEFKVEISGDPNFEDQETATYTRYIVDVLRVQDDGTYIGLESFEGVVLDDSSSSDFISTVINDDSASGSSLIAVTTYADTENPSELEGAAVSAESLTAVPTYDGSEKQIAYDLANSCSEFSFTGTFNLGFTEYLGTPDAAAAAVTEASTGMSSVAKVLKDEAVVIGSMTLNISNDATPTATVTLTLTGDGSDGFTSDTVANGTVSAVLSAGVNSTGAYTVTASGGSVPLVDAASVNITYVRDKAITITDDGNGNLEIDSDSAGDADISLNSSGTNTISYGSLDDTVATANLMWKLASDPSQGPAVAIAANVQTATYYQQPDESSLSEVLADGEDGSAISRSNVSAAALAVDDEGLFALNKVDDLLQIVVPDFETNYLVSQDVIDYCDGRKDRFAIVSVPEGYSYSEAISYKKSVVNKNSNRAAMYYPHVTIIDPVTEKQILFPPGSIVAGIYARTDSARNVSKAPAGVNDGSLRMATGLEIELTPAQVGQVNLANVNNLVNFPHTGLVVWGARTLESGGEFPYIQMRRLFMYLEKSVFNNTQMHVFESNTDSLRSAIKIQIETFLLELFNQGYFGGATPSESFFVICDRSNNPASSVAKGILYCDIGVAPTRPAEFVVFRFQQKTLDS